MLEKIANTVRALTMDAVERAHSGHPGMPLGCAEIGAVLYAEAMRFDPSAPDWPARDRFVLSAGHGSMFLYAFLHLTGYDLPLEELKNFRQLHSRTPGHPEYGVVPGAETTTGPLGQGIANAVGLALAERMAAAEYNTAEHTLIDHHTYVIAGDGDLMEGVSGEASSLAGHLGLGRLIVFYDDNEVSIDGYTDITFTEDVGRRYEAYGWQVQHIDGHDLDAIRAALAAAKAETERPSLIVARTQIGKSSPLAGKPKAHSDAMGAEAHAQQRANIGWPDQDFFVPPDVYEFFAARRAEWERARIQWEATFAAWSAANPAKRAQWDAAWSRQVPVDLAEALPKFAAGSSAATRDSGGQVIQALAAKVPALVGGSADLNASTKTAIQGSETVQKGHYGGRNIAFGVREHAMGAIANGITLYGPFRCFTATFLSFADYMRPPIRLAALMKCPSVFVFTHDSIYVGEDGPTHQPVEQAESLRVIPGLRVFRPADGVETGYAWVAALQRTDGPTALLFTRQKVTEQARDGDPALTLRGGYVLRRERGPLQLVLVAAGSEVGLAVAAAERLEAGGAGVRVVSMPERGLFLAQDEAYRREVLPDAVPRLVIEAGSPSGWWQIARLGRDRVYGLDRFGESAPGDKVAAHLGFTPEQVAEAAKALLG